jgi:hypothetical protein
MRTSARDIRAARARANGQNELVRSDASLSYFLMEAAATWTTRVHGSESMFTPVRAGPGSGDHTHVTIPGRPLNNLEAGAGSIRPSNSASLRFRRTFASSWRCRSCPCCRQPWTRCCGCWPRCPAWSASSVTSAASYSSRGQRGPGQAASLISVGR